MPGFSSLEIGKRALLAQKFGLDVTSNNIANVNTPGYSRRSAILSETPPLNQNGAWVGTGATANRIATFRDEFLDKEIKTTISKNSGYGIDSDYFNKIQAIFAEPDGNTIGNSVNDFLTSFDQLAQSPENVSLRSLVLDQGKSLAEKFNSLANQISELRNDTYKSMQIKTDNVNQLLSDIADLNKQITASSTLSDSGESQTLVDQRDQKLEDLSKLMNITTSTSDNGAVNVFVDGVSLVSQNDSATIQLVTQVNPATGERTAALQKIDAKSGVTTPFDPQSGELNSLQKQYNVTLDDKDSSGGFSVAKNLNDFANALVQSVNSKTIQGYGLDDNGANPPGRAFFDPSVGYVSAFDIKISADIDGKPRDIPLSGVTGEPGNSDIAQLIGRIQQDRSFLGGETPDGFYAGLASRIGSAMKEAQNGQSTSQLVYEQMSNQRESMMGVNLDEEAVNLIKYQKAFEASSRIVSITNELLGTVVNLGK